MEASRGLRIAKQEFLRELSLIKAPNFHVLCGHVYRLECFDLHLETRLLCSRVDSEVLVKLWLCLLVGSGG